MTKRELVSPFKRKYDDPVRDYLVLHGSVLINFLLMTFRQVLCEDCIPLTLHNIYGIHIIQFVLNISATRQTFVINVTLPCTCTCIHCRAIDIFISHNKSDCVELSRGEAAVINPTVVGSIPTMVRVFLCPCVGTIPSLGLTLTWSIGRKWALHVTLYNSICCKYKCYRANVCKKRNSSLYIRSIRRFDEGLTLEPSKSFTMVIRPLSTRLCFTLSHRRCNIVSLESINLYSTTQWFDEGFTLAVQNFKWDSFMLLLWTPVVQRVDSISH